MGADYIIHLVQHYYRTGHSPTCALLSFMVVPKDCVAALEIGVVPLAAGACRAGLITGVCRVARVVPLALPGAVMTSADFSTAWCLNPP